MLTGELTVRLNGEVLFLKTGDRLHIAPGQVHSMWNRAESKAVVQWQVQPALDTEYFLETVTGLAGEGKTNPDGVPALWQLALLVNRFGKVIRLATLPFPLQRAVFLLLTPVSWLLGYRPTYQKYLD